MREYVCKDKFFSFKQTLGQRGVFEHLKRKNTPVLFASKGD